MHWGQKLFILLERKFSSKEDAQHRLSGDRKGLLSTVRNYAVREVAEDAVSNSMDLGGRFRAVSLRLIALGVHPGRKQIQQTQTDPNWLYPQIKGRGSAEVTWVVGYFQKGGANWSPFIPTGGKGAVLPPNTPRENSLSTTVWGV